MRWRKTGWHQVRAWTLGTLASFALTSPDGDLEPLWPAISGIEAALDARGEAWTLVNAMRASAEGGRTERLPEGRPTSTLSPARTLRGLTSSWSTTACSSLRRW